MALFSSPSSDASPLLETLKTLYPLACLLAGPEEAPDLLLRVYQQAAERPPTDRPDNLNEWLLALLRETSLDREASDEGNFSGTETGGAPNADSSPADSLRQEVAEQRAEEALPVALAACSPQERFLLAVDALEESEDPQQDPPRPLPLDTTTSDARAALWNSLRAVLSEPESALVEEALSDAFLREAVRNLITSRFSPVPRSLRSEIREIVQREAAQTARAKDSPAEEDEPSSPAKSSSLLDRLPPRPTPRFLFLTLLIGVLVVAGGIGVSYVTQSSSAPSPSSTSLIAFSAEQAGSVAPDVRTSNRAKAKAYVESTWERRIQVPAIEGAQLQGVGRIRTGDDTEIPVFLYTERDDSSRIATFAYSYALVDQIESTVTLATGIREALAQRNHPVAPEHASGTGLLWRDRDDIFVVVAPSIPADSLRSRVRPAD